MSQEPQNTFKDDGIRPIQSTELEVAATFEDDGERPIAESPEFLLRDRQLNSNSNLLENNGDQKTKDTDSSEPVDNSQLKVVDTFEADGERPIMANKYEVVDTISIDGERPITSNNS
ncbi:MAG: hypothetical protein ACFCU7_19600 [Pleurocapsa sp.]